MSPSYTDGSGVDQGATFVHDRVEVALWVGVDINVVRILIIQFAKYVLVEELGPSDSEAVHNDAAELVVCCLHIALPSASGLDTKGAVSHPGEVDFVP